MKEIGFVRLSTENNILTMNQPFIVNDITTEIIVIITFNFPLEYPKFYIKDTSLFLRYPHIEHKVEQYDAYGVCLVSDNDKVLFSKPEELLHYMYNKLINYFKKLENDELDYNEIFDEFDSYWNKTQLTLHYNSKLFESNLKLKLFDLYILSGEQQLAIVDDANKLKNFENAIGNKFQQKKILYINFDINFPSKIPTNYSEFVDAIEKVGYLKSFQNLKKNNNLYNVILFSFILPSSNKKHFACIHINQTQLEVNSKTTIISSILNRLNSKIELVGGTAKDITNSRVYSRGGNSMNVDINQKSKKIAIVGCGSVGASLAYKLLKIGCNNLLLIDSDKLSVDNIARHQLGMEYVNYNKAYALDNYLSKQFIDTNITHEITNIEVCWDKLNDCDLIISALGSDANHIEEKLILDAIDNKLPPVISCWLEANAVAGHSILFDNRLIKYKNNNGFFDMNTLFSDITILDKEYGASLTKEDLGCNSSYMPYSFLNADLHINHFANMITTYILDKNIKSIWSSIGDISKVVKYMKNTNNSHSHCLIKKNIL